MEKMISRNEAARRLGVSYGTLVNMVKAGQIREFRNPPGSTIKLIKVSEEDVDNCMKQSNAVK